ncbi:hypothetical protein PVAP13_1KG125800 [Panicum virgatum]|uniref:RanBP2-type domain-containing protein n=1 Tax=Panicum virgatum TaxID=38727 RepID=A0A8T0XDI8_PANVG|nr:hypothetical protein PVAP13_1KG125800 [Panicum virgatum]
MNRKPGDWDCRACQHLNFSRRDLCQRCGEPRGAADRGSGGGGDYANFGGRGGSSFGGGFGAGSDVRPGDWLCSCGAHNFASRSNCFKCSAFKEEAAVNSGAGGFDGDMSRSRYGFGGGAARTNRPGWKSGDWICTRCPDATSTTLPAGWNVSGATHHGTPALRCRIGADASNGPRRAEAARR